jgi:hypothetical protein
MKDVKTLPISIIIYSSYKDINVLVLLQCLMSFVISAISGIKRKINLDQDWIRNMY